MGQTRGLGGARARKRTGTARYTRRAVVGSALSVAGAGLLAGCGTSQPPATASSGSRPMAATPAPSSATPAPTTAVASVFPLPGSRTASPATEITFRGIAPHALGTIIVVGSQSGGRSGVVRLHADGRGGSYLPDAPFSPGEQVTVRTGLTLRGGAAGSFTFTVAQPAASPKAGTSRATTTPKYAQRFHSRPDLVPPPMTVTTPAHDTAPGFVLLGVKSPDGQNGPMILDTNGQVVWFEPLPVDIESINDFRLQQYHGQPVLTWWEGISTGGHGLGHYRLRDQAYREVATVQVGNGYAGGDLHEFLLSPQDTALFTVFNAVRWDLSPVGGPKDGTVLDGIVQEIEIATGRVLFEWHSLDHVALDEGYLAPPKDANAPFDYIHVNSISQDHDGNLIVSGRHTWGIYKIDHQTGAILWRLGGKRSDFAMGPGTVVAYQHDARILPNGELSIFDNGSVGSPPSPHPQSRGVILKLDLDHRTATLVHEYTHSPGIIAASQGNVQVRPSGTVFIGWGGTPTFSEYSADGALLFDAHFPPGDYSYRAYRNPWTGRPADAPAVAAVAAPGSGITVYASWNGATEVASWQILAGPDPEHLQPVATAPRSGFETTISVRTASPYIAAEAQNRAGQVLARSAAAKVDR